MAMSAKGRKARFGPVQIQKLLFLLDKEIAPYIEGPHFSFQPHHHGPYDEVISNQLSALCDVGYVRIYREEHHRTYALTASGYKQGKDILSTLTKPVRQNIAEAAQWVLSLRFGELLVAIYRHYPEMAVNSVIPRVTERYPQVLHRSPLPSFISGADRTLDLAGTLDSELGRNNCTDAEAIYSDWQAVGDDLRETMAQFQAFDERA